MSFAYRVKYTRPTTLNIKRKERRVPRVPRLRLRPCDSRLGRRVGVVADSLVAVPFPIGGYKQVPSQLVALVAEGRRPLLHI